MDATLLHSITLWISVTPLWASLSSLHVMQLSSCYDVQVYTTAPFFFFIGENRVQQEFLNEKKEKRRENKLTLSLWQRS